MELVLYLVILNIVHITISEKTLEIPESLASVLDKLNDYPENKNGANKTIGENKGDSKGISIKSKKSPKIVFSVKYDDDDDEDNEQQKESSRVGGHVQKNSSEPDNNTVRKTREDDKIIDLENKNDIPDQITDSNNSVESRNAPSDDANENIEDDKISERSEKHDDETPSEIIIDQISYDDSRRNMDISKSILLDLIKMLINKSDYETSTLVKLNMKVDTLLRDSNTLREIIKNKLIVQPCTHDHLRNGINYKTVISTPVTPYRPFIPVRVVQAAAKDQYHRKLLINSPPVFHSPTHLLHNNPITRVIPSILSVHN